MHDPATCPDCRNRTELKSTYPPGPWHDEPDRVDFHAHGLPCFLNRNHSGAWCGYVGLPPGHPLYGVSHNDIYDIHVHGGLSYSRPCHLCLCHTPAPGEPDNVWWLGFDCAHTWDIIPAYLTDDLAHDLILPDAVYRDITYARGQTESLAAQLAARP